MNDVAGRDRRHRRAPLSPGAGRAAVPGRPVAPAVGAVAPGLAGRDPEVERRRCRSPSRRSGLRSTWWAEIDRDRVQEVRRGAGAAASPPRGAGPRSAATPGGSGCAGRTAAACRRPSSRSRRPRARRSQRRRRAAGRAPRAGRRRRRTPPSGSPDAAWQPQPHEPVPLAAALAARERVAQRGAQLGDPERERRAQVLGRLGRPGSPARRRRAEHEVERAGPAATRRRGRRRLERGDRRRGGALDRRRAARRASSPARRRPGSPQPGDEVADRVLLALRRRVECAARAGSRP